MAHMTPKKITMSNRSTSSFMVVFFMANGWFVFFRGVYKAFSVQKPIAKHLDSHGEREKGFKVNPCVEESSLPSGRLR